MFSTHFFQEPVYGPFRGVVTLCVMSRHVSMPVCHFFHVLSDQNVLNRDKNVTAHDYMITPPK